MQYERVGAAGATCSSSSCVTVFPLGTTARMAEERSSTSDIEDAVDDFSSAAAVDSFLDEEVRMTCVQLVQTSYFHKKKLTREPAGSA